jgi:PhnB protein
MAVTHRPAGFSAVTPYLLVEDAERLLAFLCDAFGAQELELHRVTMPDGRIMTAAVRIEDAILELGTASSTFPARAGAFHLYVADVDAAYARALAAGAPSTLRGCSSMVTAKPASSIPPASPGSSPHTCATSHHTNSRSLSSGLHLPLPTRLLVPSTSCINECRASGD